MPQDLVTDLNPRSSSQWLDKDMEPFHGDLYDPAKGPVCGRKRDNDSLLLCAPYAHLPLHESPGDYHLFDLLITPFEISDEDEEDEDGPCCEADMIALEAELAGEDQYASFGDNYPSEDWSDEEDSNVIEDAPKNPAVPNDKYSTMAKRLLFEDDLDVDIDEDVINKSLRWCEGMRKAVRIAHGGVIPHENRRQYSDRGRTQIFFRTSRHS